MHVPGWFQRQLHEESAGRLRARWSPLWNVVYIEQRIGQPLALRRPPMEGLPLAKQKVLYEMWRRASEGYDLLMTITPGDRTRCPHCTGETRIPVMRMAEAKCERCGRTFRAMHWPLGDGLLAQLRYADPDRGGIERVARDIEAGAVAHEAARRRARHNETEAIWKEAANEIFEVAQVGWTPQEMTSHG